MIIRSIFWVFFLPIEKSILMSLGAIAHEALTFLCADSIRFESGVALQKEGVPFMGKTLSVPMALPSRTITIMVRHEMVGRLIGKQGIKLKALQAETGAKVTIDRRPTTETETKVIVKGTPNQVEDARLRISKICFAVEKNADGADLDSC